MPEECSNFVGDRIFVHAGFSRSRLVFVLFLPHHERGSLSSSSRGTAEGAMIWEVETSSFDGPERTVLVRQDEAESQVSVIENRESPRRVAPGSVLVLGDDGLEHVADWVDSYEYYPTTERDALLERVYETYKGVIDPLVAR